MRNACFIKADLIDMCIKNQYFTHGSNYSYDRMLEFAANGGSADCVASMIYVCSEDNFENILSNVEFVLNKYNGGNENEYLK